MKANKKGILLIIMGVLLIIAALAFTAYNYYESYRAGKASNNAVVQLDSQIAADSNYAVSKNMQMPVIQIDNNDYIGTIQIPTLQLNLPVMDNWSYDNLNIAPCRFSGSIYSSNMVIAGHNYKSHFGKLRRVSVGDQVIFTDSDGNKFYYEVKDLEILPSTAVDEMDSGEWDLTLFTCTIGAKTRFAVRCSLSSTTAKLL